MNKKPIRILILHSDYPDHPGHNPFFGRHGIIHESLKKAVEQEVQWHFFGGFINKEREMFWKKIALADVLLCAPSNMDNNNVHMHWDDAEVNMFRQIKKIKELNSKIKIIYFDRSHFLSNEFKQHGIFVTDFHDIDGITEIIKK